MYNHVHVKFPAFSINLNVIPTDNKISNGRHHHMKQQLEVMDMHLYYIINRAFKIIGVNTYTMHELVCMIC